MADKFGFGRLGTTGPSGAFLLSARRQRFCCFRCLVTCRSGTAPGKWTPRSKSELCRLSRSSCAQSPERRDAASLGCVRRRNDPQFAIFASARPNHAGRRASRAISDRDHACSGAQADRTSSDQPASFGRHSSQPSMPSERLRQGATPHSRATDSLNSRIDGDRMGDLPVSPYVFEGEAEVTI